MLKRKVKLGERKATIEFRSAKVGVEIKIEKNYKLQQSAEIKAKIADLNDKIKRATRVKIKLTKLKKNVKEYKSDAKNLSKEYLIGKGE
ncbi:hypothetical protein ACFDBE_01565 [Staphylococcus epidermidis]